MIGGQHTVGVCQVADIPLGRGVLLICPIKDLIAALPDKVTEDNTEDVRARLDKILALFVELTEDEQEQV